MPLIRNLEISRYKSTATADESLTRLAQASGWPDHVLSRFAISRSLQDRSKPDLVDGERKGKELRGETLFRSKQDSDYLPWVAAMIAQHACRPYRNDDEAIDLIIAHWHRGILLLVEDLNALGGDFQSLILAIARKASEHFEDSRSDDGHGKMGIASLGPIGGLVRPMIIPIGRISADADPVTVTFNDTKRYSNCHAAVSGMSGSGKTQFVKQILASAMKSCDQSTGIIFVDFAKGDVAEDGPFVKAIGAKVLHLPGDIVPVGPFHLPEYTDDAIRLAAEEKREVYSELFRNLGPKQQGRLAEAVRDSYLELRGDSEPAPDFAYVQHKLNDIYRRDGLQPDSLSELFRQLNAYQLFWSRGSSAPPVSPLHSQRWVVDVHELGGLKEVTAFTIIEQLYREMRSLPESTIDPTTGLRHIRCILAIDEAQYYLKAKNRFLQGIIREGRSKGFSVMLMCQSPDDFDQADFDYTEQLQFTYMLQCKTEPNAVARLLGVSKEEGKTLAKELGRMLPLNGIGALPGTDGQRRVLRFRLVPFFEIS